MNKTSTLVTIALMATFNSTAKAQDAGVHGMVVAGVADVPEYEGADRQKVVPFLIGRINDGNRYLAIEGPTLRANIVDSKWVEFGPQISVTPRRGSHIHSRAVARLGTIQDAVEVGAFAAIALSITAKDRIRIAIDGVQDVSGVHKGWLSTASASFESTVSPRLSLSGDVKVTYASADYAKTYFSVTPAGALSSGLSPFKAKSGIKDVGASVNISYAIDRRWSLFGIGAYRRLVGSTAESPIVKKAGSADQFVGGLGIGWSF
ncbi:MipA/OmpV family protein [Novosphingobium sp.]|uniref:MipA/OmpV family protein n=1 Tax=Novosphingobium sp. TaxID=1874826 RepID=UPI00333EDF6D